jgi:tetratricopeptide (TPR) repeat protein
VSRRALGICRELEERFIEGASLNNAGIALAARGAVPQSQVALSRALGTLAESNPQGEGYVSGSLAQRHLWLGQPRKALPVAERAWKLAYVKRLEADFIRAARRHGEAALALGDLATAEERLHHALTRARAVNLVEQELPALTALAELHRQRQQYGPARELLEQVWAPAERGPYLLFHADARNVLARIERDEGHGAAAIAAATRAYELAWCDGPPYAYHYGLTHAKQLLAELGAPEPQLPPFDESKFEPMPDVELNPKDEFYVEPGE